MTSKGRLSAARRPMWGIAAAIAVASAPFAWLTYRAATRQHPGAMLVIGAFTARFWWMVVSTLRPKRLYLTEERIVFGDPPQCEVSWKQLVGVELESAVRPRSNGTYALVERRARLILADETEFPFPIWSTGARQVAASLQAGRFNPNAVLDESQVTLVSARDGKVIATAEVVDPALR